MGYFEEIKNLIIEASRLVGAPLEYEKDFEIKYQPINHKPVALPQGKMAVYTFVYNGNFLKIGQASANAGARYRNQHYNPNAANSTLANRLINDPENSSLVNEDNVKQWIKENCERYDVIIDKEYGKFALNFIEGMLHYKYKPKYEG